MTTQPKPSDSACVHGPDANYDADGFCLRCGASLFPSAPVGADDSVQRLRDAVEDYRRKCMCYALNRELGDYELASRLKLESLIADLFRELEQSRAEIARLRTALETICEQGRNPTAEVVLGL